MNAAASLSGPSFAQRLAAYKQLIDADIAAYGRYAKEHTAAQYGPYAALDVAIFVDLVSRGGKRLRGALVMVGYEMSGGQNRDMIIQAARAIEMLHAYLLITDDIQDRSSLRRGRPTAHQLFATYHRKHHLKGDAAYAGISLALNSALAGAHAAQIILANLDADPQLRLNVLSIVNRTMQITAHGQTYDIMNELVRRPAAVDIDRVLEWKSALYTCINPLHVGMVLAGADCQATDAITPYALHVGRAFQITDDILGVFGDAATLGKSPLDDIREGKATLMAAYALQHGLPADVILLRGALGNQQLTRADLAHCRRVIIRSGALDYARNLAMQEVASALAALDQAAERWPAADVAFLADLAHHIETRVQ